MDTSERIDRVVVGRGVRAMPMENGAAVSLHKARLLASILTKRWQSPQLCATAKEWTDLDGACRDLLALTDQPGHQDLWRDCSESREEADRWLAFAKDFDEKDSNSLPGKLQSINDHLLRRSVLASSGTAISLVDITVFVAMSSIIPEHQEIHQNLLRWFDYIQNEDSVAMCVKKLPIKKPNFEPQVILEDLAKKSARAAPVAPTIENQASATELLKNESNGVSQVTTEREDKVKEAAASVISKTENKKENKKKKEERSVVQKKEMDASVSSLDIRVGLVRKVWKHPSADSLLVEEIDLGDGGVRQVVSGLAKYLKEEDMLDRRIVMIANVKPGKLRDVLSAGLVLCASTSDHSRVEPLLPPGAAAVGERITFDGHDGKPEEVLNPKKKHLEKILPDFFTDGNGVATYQGIPFMTSAGPCTSSLVKAAIK